MSSVQPQPTNRWIFVAFAAFLLSLLLRLIHFNQGLWCDEMGVLLDYAHGSWQSIAAARPGQYTPGNHILHTLVTKAILTAAWHIAPGQWSTDNSAMLARLPSLLAGSLLSPLLAWPLRRQSPRLALLVMVFVATQPWLIAFSDEARGYSLMTLLGVAATLRLPTVANRWPVGYALLLAAAVYTVPVAAMLLPAHALVMMVWHRPAFRNWMRGAGLSLGVIALIFWPMRLGILDYLQHPQPTPDRFIVFLNQLPRLMLAGEYLPRANDPFAVIDPGYGIMDWIIPVLLLLVGTRWAWREQALRQPTAALGAVVFLFITTAAVIPAAGQVRFVPWAGVWLAIAMAVVAQLIFHRCHRWIATACLLLLVGWQIDRAVVLLPCQPVREAITEADRLAPPGTKICVGFLAARETVQLYGMQACRHEVVAAPSPWDLLTAEKAGRPWLVLSFEPMIHDTAPGLWRYILANYKLRDRLPGRISAVAIYEPR